MEALFAVGSTLATAASTAGTAAGGLSSIFAGTSSAMTVLQGGATAASILSSVTAGRSARAQGDMQAAAYGWSADLARVQAEAARSTAGINAGWYDMSAGQAELQAEAARINASAEATGIRNKLVDVVGQQRVAFAASGTDPTRGSAVRVQEATAARARDDIALATLRGDMAAAGARIQAAEARTRAAMTRAGGEADAAAKSIYGSQQDIQAALAGARGQSAESSSWLDALGSAFKFGTDVMKRK